MRVLQVTNSLAAEFGGTAAACAQLANHLIRAGVDVSSLELGNDNGVGPRWPLDRAVSAAACRPAWPARFGFCRDLGALVASLPPPDLVHLHGLWRLHFAQAARYAARANLPLVVSTHGMLHPPALEQRAALKRLARRIFQDAVLRQARCLHTTAADEADAIRRLGFDRPIAVVGWGVDMPPEDVPPARAPDRRVLLYLGRLHPSKGLDTLLRSWAAVRGRFCGWELVVAGYDEGGYRATLTTLASTLGVEASVRFADPVAGEARERLFASSSLVVLPSPAENFGFVVPEALARGVPVIATEGAPWASLVAEQCGWWIPFGDDPLAAALVDALSRTDVDLHAMGERGRLFARAHFGWNAAAAAMKRLYAWVLGQEDVPEFVRTEVNS